MSTQQLIATLPTEIEKAAARIGPHILKTPLLESPYLGGDSSKCRVFFKLESEQVTGSFKARGSLNKILSLHEDHDATTSTTLVTSSTGNHAQGFARAVGILEKQQQKGSGKRKGIIYMPETAQPAKVKALQQCYPHIELVFHGQDCSVTEEFAKQTAIDNGLIYVPPYNDLHVIAGQGTVGLEMLEQAPSNQIDVCFVCIGGGGLMSGVAAYLKSKQPNVQIIGCQPEQSPEMYLSVQKGELVYLDNPQPTLSDGSAGGIEQGSVTFPICQELVDDYVLVSEEEIAAAIRWMVDHHHKIIEGAAGVALAAFQKQLEKNPEQYANKNVAIVICGSNIGTEALTTILAAKKE